MLQSIDNPQPMYIPTRISPDVVASSRQLIPLGIVEQAGKSFYKFDLGDSWYKAIKFYPVSVIRSINQMSETEVNETEVVIEPAKVVAEPVLPTINIGVAEPDQTPAPVVEPEVNEAGVTVIKATGPLRWEVRHIMTWSEQIDGNLDDPKYAAMLNGGWTLIHQQVNTTISDETCDGVLTITHYIIATFKRRVVTS